IDHQADDADVCVKSGSPGVRYSEPLGYCTCDPMGSEYLTPGLLAFNDLNHDARDIVARAVVERQLPQAVGAFLHVGMILDELEDLLVGHRAGEAVGTQQEAIA